jgi:hypothetical protein
MLDFFKSMEVTVRSPRAVTACACLLAVLAGSRAATAQDNRIVLPFGQLIAEQSRPSFSIIGAGARPAGMGGAFTALADDAAAASFNPAGLALLVEPEVSVVGSALERTDSYSRFRTLSAPPVSFYSDSEITFDTTSLNFAAVTLPIELARRNFCLQLSYHRLIDFTYEGEREFTGAIPDRGVSGAFAQRIAQSGDIHTYNLAAAYQFTQRLSLGVNLSWWDGAWEFQTSNGVVEPGANELFFTYRQENEISGFNWNAGLLLRYRYLNLGAMYRAAFDADYATDSEFAANFGVPAITEPEIAGPLAWPDSWTFGIAIKPFDTWTITADWARYNWSGMEFHGVGPEKVGTVNFFDLEPPEYSETPDLDVWRFGTEYTLFAGRTAIALRAGYFDEPQPQRVPIEGNEASYEGYSAGIGIAAGRFRIDLAYQERVGSAIVTQFVDPRIIATGQLQKQAIGEVETTDRRLFVGLLYQFSSRDAIGKAFRFLLVGPAEEPPADAP